MREKNAAWQKANPASSQARQKRYSEKNPGLKAGKYKAWLVKYPDKLKSYNAKARSTPHGLINDSIRRRINGTIRSGSKFGRKTYELLEFTVEQLRSHLEAQFWPGMTWGNYGRGGWHIDHIIPLSALKYTFPDDTAFKRAWSLQSLQPLWEFDNRSKGAKLDTPLNRGIAL